MDVERTFIAQLDDVLGEFEREAGLIRSVEGYDSTRAQVRFLTRARAVVLRVAGTTSAYGEQCEQILAENAVEGWKAERVVGVLESLRADVAAGYLDSVSQLIHGEVFADMLDMSDHLLEEGYKDPAAVVAGSALEVHLRALCDLNFVPRTDERGRALKAERLNADLAGGGFYSKPDQKHVTSWLAVRNDAAHGNYDSYTADQVRLLIASVRDFISRHPA